MTLLLGSRSEIALLMHLVPTGSMCFIISANLTDGDLNPLQRAFFTLPHSKWCPMHLDLTEVLNELSGTELVFFVYAYMNTIRNTHLTLKKTTPTNKPKKHQNQNLYQQ